MPAVPFSQVAVQLRPKDNIAVAARDLAPGMEVLLEGGAVTLGDRLLIRYGGEYLLVGLGRSVSSVRPRISVETKLDA